MASVKFFDLFAGMGGFHVGFAQGFAEVGFQPVSVGASEIKRSAQEALHWNFPDQRVWGDIRKVSTVNIPDFDFLLAGFPCQAFSSAGRRQGFADTRGTLFFEVERLLREKRPYGFLLENVEGLVTHNKRYPDDPIGETFSTILATLQELGYKVSWTILDAQDFGVPQIRRRVYIAGTLKSYPWLTDFPLGALRTFGHVMEHGLPVVKTPFTEKLLSLYTPYELYGKAIKDKRGGGNNIHSWDIETHGSISPHQKALMTKLLTERRKKCWAEEIGIDWMDGMPLTTDQISSFYKAPDLQEMLNDLEAKGYLRLEHPKKKVKEVTDTGVITNRVSDTTKPKGYNIVTGKLSFPFTRILHPDYPTPTLVATDMERLGVVDIDGLRGLSIREGLDLFGYPQTYSLDCCGTTRKGLKEAYDLLGNTVCVPVIKAISTRLANDYVSYNLGGIYDRTAASSI